MHKNIKMLIKQCCRAWRVISSLCYYTILYNIMKFVVSDCYIIYPYIVKDTPTGNSVPYDFLKSFKY